MGAVEPLLNLVAEEVAAKLETRVSFDLGGLWAHDLQGGRAAAFQKLVAGGVPVQEALVTSGLLAAEG